jgi:hypothetical protein
MKNRPKIVRRLSRRRASVHALPRIVTEHRLIRQALTPSPCEVLGRFALFEHSWFQVRWWKRSLHTSPPAPGITVESRPSRFPLQTEKTGWPNLLRGRQLYLGLRPLPCRGRRRWSKAYPRGLFSIVRGNQWPGARVRTGSDSLSAWTFRSSVTKRSPTSAFITYPLAPAASASPRASCPLTTTI